MLVLTRKQDQSIHIGNDIVITVVRIGPGNVRIGITAPRELNIARAELRAEDEPIAAPAESSHQTRHHRKCWDCGNVAEHDDCVVPHVLCRRCGSQDTRRVRTESAEEVVHS